MDFKNIDKNLLSSFISKQIDHVTCIECCKYFIVPTTAVCGHTLCHTCWRGRHTCPCGTKHDRKKLKLNLPLQELTKHVFTLGEAFAELFKIQLDELLLDAPVCTDLQRDPNKNIDEWLASSQNHFSVPPTNSQKSTQSNAHVEHVTSHVQVYTENKKKPTHMEKKYAPQKQCDWDKIEVMSESENRPNQNKENIVGPMDIEPFDFIIDENEFSIDKPRRSFRNRENKNNNIVYTTNENISNKNDCQTNDSEETNKTSHKTLKSWNSVKRMKKEFSKLNKQNRNKLNVSIEMCKKTQPITNKVAENIIIQPTAYTIDDNTPKSTSGINNKCDLSVLSKEPIDSDKGINVDISPNCKFKNYEKDTITPKVCFFKRSILHNTNKCINSKTDLSSVQNSANNDMDDIKITIKIGSTLTNISIKKKDNDVQLNVQTDREIQTSLKDVKNPINEMCETTAVNNLEKENIITGNMSVKNAMPIICTFKNNTQNKLLEKSISTKKNTASADTSTAHVEITASVENELSHTMENIDTQSRKGKPEIPTKINKDSQITVKTLTGIQQDVDVLNELDIFDSESVKEGNVQLLKDAKGTQSAIIVPTLKNRTQKNSDKRNRDDNDGNDQPATKKIKVMDGNKSLNVIKENSLTEDELEKINVIEQCSELDNYNAIISQVFANIDADMKDLHKTRSPINKTQDKSQVSKTKYGNTDVDKNEVNEKYSENIFSIIDRESEGNENVVRDNFMPISENSKAGNKDQNVESQSAMDTNRKNVPCDEFDVVMQSTPLQDDAFSDHSVVEETPQKSSSFAKVKNKNDAGSGHAKTSNHRALSLERKTQQEEIVIDDDSNVISLSNSVDTTRNKTVLDKARPRTTLETPVTINKFVDHIKYNSTPVAKKSLNFNAENVQDHEETLCPSAFVAAKTTQEKEFLSDAFEQSYSPSPTLRTKTVQRDAKYCIAGSCLSAQEQANLKKLCLRKSWTFVEKYTKDITHLVVGVDEENKSQRSVKYMCALAASKWIVSYAWVARCLQSADAVDEEPFEALDGTGEPGPRRARLAPRGLFAGITFYCMPPFNVLDENTLQEMLVAAGGRVVGDARGVRAADRPALLLAEPEHTQEDRFIYLAMKMSVVPVNYEWVLNCLGSYTLSSIHELLLCPSALLPAVTDKWPPELIAREDE